MRANLVGFELTPAQTAAVVVALHEALGVPLDPHPDDLRGRALAKRIDLMARGAGWAEIELADALYYYLQPYDGQGAFCLSVEQVCGLGFYREHVTGAFELLGLLPGEGRNPDLWMNAPGARRIIRIPVRWVDSLVWREDDGMTAEEEEKVSA